MKKCIALLILILCFTCNAYASTRSLQIDFLVSGVSDPTTGLPVAGGTAYFYEAGTTTAKNIYTDKAMTAPYTSYALDEAGAIQLYGNGNYKIVIKDADGSTVSTYDNVFIQAANFYMRTVTSASVTATIHDDFILCSTNANQITVAMPAASTAVSKLTIKRSGSNNVVIDPNGAETIDGAATYTISGDKYSVEVVSDGSNWFVSTTAMTYMMDADGDTKIQVEESTDEDIIRFDIGGTEQVTIQDGKFEPTTDNDVDLGSETKEFKDLRLDGIAYLDVLYLSTSVGEGIMGHIYPDNDDNSDLGGTGREWKDLYVDGIAYIDALDFNGTAISATAAEINQLATVDSTTISANQWAALGGIAETLISSELNVLDGITADVNELNKMDGIANPPVAGGASAGRILRSTKISLGDIANDGDVDISSAGGYNPVIFTTTDGVAPAATDNNISLDAAGEILTFLDDAITGTIEGVISCSLLLNKTASTLIPFAGVSTNTLQLYLANESGTKYALHTLLDAAEEVIVLVTYITY